MRKSACKKQKSTTEKQKKAGEKPVFYEDEVGITGTVWTRDRK